MSRFPVALSAVTAALFVAACSGGGVTPSNGVVSANAAAAHLPDAGYARPKFLRLMRIPNHPPPHKHAITGAMRARARAGGWTPLSSVPSFTNGPQTELLLTDGTVIVQDYCTPNWYRLTPDQNGNYATGTWSEIASMPSTYAPLYFASAVLADGKVIANGGEYNGSGCSPTETNLGAIYDPFSNKWAAVTGPSGWGEIGDAQSAVLSNGTYMLGNCCYNDQAQLNEASMSWTIVGNGKHDENSEEGWALLRNGDLLAADVQDAPNTEVYSPSANEWTSAGSTPVNLVSGFEIGPETMRPDDTVWVAGASGYSAVYSEKSGKWTQGPTFPVVGGAQIDVADGPSSLLTDGTVLIAASPGLYQTPAYFYIFNGKKLKNIPAPPDAPNDSSYNVRLLMLPNGQVLEDDGSSDIEVYTSGRKVDQRSAPHITSVPTSLTPGSTYTATGKLFNGMSQANMYGDDVQQATNFPLVRIVNNTTGHVFYARTHDQSYMGVGSKKTVTTKFDVPSGIETGASSLTVVTNGIASNSVAVTIK